MIVSEFTAVAPETAPAAQRTLATRPLRKRVFHVLRRGHLYCGLFLFPWAILYGVTAFLFNHPTAFSDQPTATFGKSAAAGTPLESLPTPGELAAALVAKLNETQKPPTPYTLAGEAKYLRDNAFATVKADGQTLSILIDLKNGGGTVRVAPTVERKEPGKAPFAVGSRAGPVGRGSGVRGPGSRGSNMPSSSEGIKLDDPIHERIKASVPTLVERAGFPSGEVTVTSVPDVVFPVEADGKTWTATYNPMTGALSGTSVVAKPENELSIRRFLTRLHTTHGYPNEVNDRWFWAVVVDGMAFTMCFWALTGLVMWWQIKATRKIGLLVMLCSGGAATWLGFAMHAALSQ